ncbi:phytoene desaturase family protein [Amycolatopsis sp. NPDC004368]
MRTVPGRTDGIAVVGAGLAGLSAALHLAGRGRRVTVVERGPGPRGRVGRVELDGYHPDAGPTVLTRPEIVRDTFAAAGAGLAEYPPLRRLDPAYTVCFADAGRLPVHSGAEAMAEAVRAFAGSAEAAGYRRLRRWFTRLYRAEFDRFIESNIDSPLRRVFTFQALYAGESPMRALARYAVIPYVDTVGGVHFPEGGMAAVPRALAAAAGVRFRYGDRAEVLERSGSRVPAVLTASGDRIPCDAVVLTGELPGSYRLLRRTPRRLRPAPSVHAGAAGHWPDTGHHTLSFSHAWASTFGELITDGRQMSDPSVLVTRPTPSDPNLAPAGRHLFSILAPAPNLDRGPIDWSREAEPAAAALLDEVRQRLLPGLDAEVWHVISPPDWAARGMVAGTPFSYAHSFGRTGPFRPRNLPRGAEDVVPGGAGTVPGVGVPTVLLSGRPAADRITGPDPSFGTEDPR